MTKMDVAGFIIAGMSNGLKTEPDDQVRSMLISGMVEGWEHRRYLNPKPRIMLPVQEETAADMAEENVILN